MAKILHSGPISSVASQGSLWASGGYDNRLILWDGGPGAPRAIAQGMHDHLVNHCEFSPDGRFLVSASSDYSARIWSLPALRLTAVLSEHDDDVDMATFSPDSRWVGTCALDRRVRVFDLQGRCHHVLAGHSGNIIALLWRPDGRQLVSSSVDGTVREWSLAEGREVACHDLQSVRTDSIVLDHLGRILAGDDRGRIAVIQGGTIAYADAHQAGIKKLVFCPIRRVLVSLSYDRSLAVWCLSDRGELRELQRSTLPALIWSRAAAVLDAERLLVGTFGTRPAVYDWVRDHWDLDGVAANAGINAVTMHKAQCWSVGDAGVVHRAGNPHAHTGSLCNFLVSTGDRVFSGGQLGQLFDADNGRVLHQHRSPLNCGASFLREGLPHLAVGTYTGEILVFALEGGADPRQVAEIPVYENAVKGVAVSRGELFSVCASTAIAWHACDTFRLIRRIDRAHDKIANACVPVMDGLIATVARDRCLRLWAGGIAETFLTPHANSVKALAVTPDGRRLLTGSYGGTVAEFDVPGRQWIRTLRLTTAGISSITYDPGRGCFLAAAYDGEIHVVE